jgi:hypothetical protein
VTVGFLYLAIFLLGFTLALVSGLVRRILHPSELCDRVVVPSHEHWANLQTPRSDFVVSFILLFGLSTFLVHGFATMAVLHEIGIGIIAGVIGAIVLRVWLRTVCDPTKSDVGEGADAQVVRDIPPAGFGQVEVDLAGTRCTLAARSGTESTILAGTHVRILDRQESVVVVVPRDPNP